MPPDAPPRLRVDLNLATLWRRPARQGGPRIGALRLDARGCAALRELGFEGVQDSPPFAAPRRACEAAGLHRTVGAIVPAARVARAARRWAGRGYGAGTLLVGHGFESEAEASAIASAVIEASRAADLPLYLETHRATATEDLRRTAALARHHPELRFNADLSHWVTAYGPAGLASLEPELDVVLAAVRFAHGRVSDRGQAQVTGVREAPTLPLFRELWTRCFEGYLREARARGDETDAPVEPFVFAPELLAPETGYAPVAPGPAGLAEQGDRLEDALALTGIARACFAAATDRIRDQGPARRPTLASLVPAGAGPGEPEAPVEACDGRPVTAPVPIRSLAELEAALAEHPVDHHLRVRLGDVADARADELALGRDVLAAARRGRRSVLLDTARGTALHDPRRAAALVAALGPGEEGGPRFCLDLAEWYLGGELVLGNLGRALLVIEPVLARTDAIVRRVGTAEREHCHLDPEAWRPARWRIPELIELGAVLHHRHAWRRARRGWPAGAGPP